MTWPQLCWVMPQIKTGFYRHYKGDLYEVLSIATHSESKESLVVYRSVEVGQIWARPCSMFVETVDIDGNTVPRFQWIEPLHDERARGAVLVR